MIRFKDILFGKVLYCELVKETIIDAQKNMNVKADTNLENKDQSNAKVNIAETITKNQEVKSKEKVEKKKTSIFSRIKKIASKKSK